MCGRANILNTIKICNSIVPHFAYICPPSILTCWRIEVQTETTEISPCLRTGSKVTPSSPQRSKGGGAGDLALSSLSPGEMGRKGKGNNNGRKKHPKGRLQPERRVRVRKAKQRELNQVLISVALWVLLVSSDGILENQSSKRKRGGRISLHKIRKKFLANLLLAYFLLKGNPVPPVLPTCNGSTSENGILKYTRYYSHKILFTTCVWYEN